VVNEGLGSLWLAARRDDRLADLQGPIADRATCMAGLAIDAQSDAADAAGYANPRRVEGAWLRDGETRMDDQQHALAGLLLTVPIARAGDASGDEPDNETPSSLLWALALLLALNPARAVFGVPRRNARGAAGPSPVRLAALGGAIGGIAAVVVAALADPLLDALDVSDPSFRIAAGAIAVLAGVADLFRRPPSPDPALPGWRAALVPVTVPIVARPAVLMLAVGAGADRSPLVTLVAMAAGVGLLTGLASRGPARAPEQRVLVWAGRLLAAGLVAAGVLLVVAGIVDV
jgi:small neutral amino acid transporter SnatA (MarC family)